jgi:AmmeMemoRadiSam system protein A
MPTTIAVKVARPDPVMLPEAARRGLLDLARTAVAVAARALPPDALTRSAAAIRGIDRCGAAFVTLTRDGVLRGCMGMLDPDRPLAESVIEAAACATRADPRFEPVEPAEVAALEIGVSVLGPMVRIADPLSFRLGVDGIVVERHGRRGLLLPEVAAMVGDRVEMLEIACRKAALPPAAWRDPGTAVYVFRTERFEGPATAVAVTDVAPDPVAGTPVEAIASPEPAQPGSAGDPNRRP